ncbi:leucine-rich repeat-containing protein 52-like [Rhineura floridana]|uniref:leucine-rich repeat-containing protein 52-like n=1 Tax=Rhineura floridana TaxID=261503 RepID=UPI002AC7EDC2|nr:leucine-rich repeat-containing protein 52-like [Rhineura floridana]
MGHLVLPSFHSSTSLWIAFLIGIKWTQRGLSCPQECTCEKWQVNCSGKMLDQVPTGIPLITKELILANNNLSSLPLLQMSYLNELVYLDCSHNLVEMGLDFTFPGIVKLTYLDLSFNRLSYITSHTFSQLNKLLLLNLSSNPMMLDIKEKAFESNSLLRYLDMSDCGLTYISAELFRHLHNLHILGIKGNPWNCDCNFLEFCNWMKKADTLYPNSEEITCSKPELLKGLTVLEAESKLHYLCLVHLETEDFIFTALIAFCIFFGGTLVAWLAGISTVIYYHPVMKVDDESEDEEYRMI